MHRKSVLGAIVLIEFLFFINVCAAQTPLIPNGDFSNGLSGWTTGVLREGTGLFQGYPKILIHNDVISGRQAYKPSVALDVPGGTAAYVQSSYFLLSTPQKLKLEVFGHYQVTLATIQVVMEGDPNPIIIDNFPPPRVEVNELPITKEYSLGGDFVGKRIAIRLVGESIRGSKESQGVFVDYDDVSIGEAAPPPPPPPPVITTTTTGIPPPLPPPPIVIPSSDWLPFALVLAANAVAVAMIFIAIKASTTKRKLPTYARFRSVYPSRCSNCGAEIEPTRLYCRRCGGIVLRTT